MQQAPDLMAFLLNHTSQHIAQGYARQTAT